MTILETERLTLRELTEADYPALCRMLMDEQVMYAYAHAFSETEGFWVVFQDADTGEYVETKSG